MVLTCYNTRGITSQRRKHAAHRNILYKPKINQRADDMGDRGKWKRTHIKTNLEGKEYTKHTQATKMQNNYKHLNYKDYTNTEKVRSCGKT
jgi:hypothetical protein